MITSRLRKVNLKREILWIMKEYSSAIFASPKLVETTSSRYLISLFSNQWLDLYLRRIIRQTDQMIVSPEGWGTREPILGKAGTIKC